MPENKGITKGQESHRSFGDRGEARAVAYLEEQGVVILARNYKKGKGEIDIIGTEDNVLVFFEVKSRTGIGAAEAVDLRKQKRISDAADHFIYERGIPEDTPMRFDVITEEGGNIRRIRDAFEYRGSRW